MTQSKLNVLFIGPDIFIPENKNGVNKTTYNILKSNTGLQASFLYPEYGDSVALDDESFSHVTLLPVKSIKPSRKGLVSKATSFLSANPFIVEDSETLNSLKEKMLEVIEDFDVIQIMSLALVPLIDHIPMKLRGKVVICAIDSLSFFYESRVANEKNFIKKLIWKMELSKAQRFETKYYNLVPKVLFVSQMDEIYARENFKTNAILRGLYYGVDTHKFDSMVSSESVAYEEESLIFTGNFDYGPNIDGADFLVEEVMPLLWDKKPNVKLYLAGGNPSEKLKNITDKRIEVTGFVDSLVPYIQKSKIFLSPIFFGAGVKTKVLEAMYLEKIVVGTPQSFNAIYSEDGRDCLKVDDYRNPNAWVEVICETLDQFELRESIGREAKKSIQEKHDWSEVKINYLNEYRDLNK
ncbi:hypothetical protein A9Q84_05125 [Halobacteriovorax marinus]|uniref:Glycosyltransferase n=1 Tax=Halobacteriovorax marinus TaxID=97084 RepID=A0A1Y5FB67_9BACT|nr:hypothetical protein A9Q84_05125 [Halobacteriovorax marinus]